MMEQFDIVVTGGSGFLGSHLSDYLSEEGHDVTIFDIVQSPWLRKNQRMIIGDILDYEQIEAAVKGAKYVYHLAGVADIGNAAAKPKEALEKNIIGSMNVIEACINQKVERLLFASTLYVYSDKGSFYRVSKQAVESMLEAYNAEFGLAFTILRYGSLYGPRAQEWNGLKQYIVQAVRKRKIVYPGTGAERREYIHVQDAAKLSVKALEPEFANECLTITGTQTMSTKEVMAMVKEIIGRAIEIEFSANEPGHNPFHYSLTPYRYTPRRGKKIVPSTFVDLGQGIMDVVEELEPIYSSEL